MMITNPQAARTAGVDPTRLAHLQTYLASLVDTGAVAGASLRMVRHGQVCVETAVGMADVASEREFAVDTVVRLYSMTKPVTTVAAMMLYEQGLFHLDDPVARYLPAFEHTPVWLGPGHGLEHTVAQKSLLTIRHLLTHTSGLTYSFMNDNPVDAAYREQGIEIPGGPLSLESLVDRLADIPLMFQPGSRWQYSVAMDVLGRLIELWSGQSLAQFLAERIFAPLGMHDTGFAVTAEQKDRFASLYGPVQGGSLGQVGKRSPLERLSPSGVVLLDSAQDSAFLSMPAGCSGGGGLVGTLGDYSRFAQMLLNKGVLSGERLLGRKTVEFMCRNHLPDGRDMAAMGQAVWSETSMAGIGHGLGFAVVLDPVEAQMLTSAGECHWGGAASTFFWIDPEEDLQVVFLCQLYPSSTWPIRRQLRSLVYQTLV